MKKTIFILIVLFFTLTLQALVDMNDIVPAFTGEAQGQIEGAVIEGAIHFLQAKSHSDLLLMEYEKSANQPFNFSAALDHAEKAIGELEKSIEEYEKSVSLGKQAGYVDEILQKFKNFNYDGFSADKRLNNDVMVLVKSYFSAGNILGAYQQNVDHIGEILITMEQIKEKLKINQLADITLFWQLVQRFSKAALFGNYCTITAATIFTQ